MSNYEIMLILKPDSTDEAVERVLEKVAGGIAPGGKITKKDLWGKRSLAYPLKDLTEATYAVLGFESEPDRVKSLGKTLRLDQNILRFMVTRL